MRMVLPDCFLSALVAFIELAISLSFELLLLACCRSLFYPRCHVLCFFAFVEFSAAAFRTLSLGERGAWSGGMSRRGSS